MYRFAMNDLLQWKGKKNRKPLIIMGARQVGKTWLMKEFGKNCYEKTAYISFYNNQRMNAVFENDFDIERIIMNLNIESGVTITPGNTLIILDEIQNTPKALESLKYFCEEAPEYHIIAAGSLLGVAIHEGVSYPVGDCCVYMEADSFLPICEQFEFLRSSSYEKNELLGEGFRLRTMKFRGQISQGLVQPLSILPEGTYKISLQIKSQY